LGEDALSSLLGLDGLVEQEELSADERRLIGILRAQNDESVGRLAERLGMDFIRFAEVLGSMQDRGVVAVSGSPGEEQVHLCR
jgi:predicted transcriptional regulator